ncbi:polyphenol oxidase family protein [Arabiibacter massiliensis]|uniref:polyphenol oxidase family protein n=1 Tax=Arabiibacter massiliensis TaxID=1870985 RepID=UPI0009BA0015|nr:polyphenol oxidase family protein [Arabiibacter massiliensis]
MAATDRLPIPHLSARRFGARLLPALTDDALFEAAGVRVAFTGRAGGESEGPYASLNLGGHVGDDPAAVARNRELLLEALGAAGMPLVVPNQVHGDALAFVDDAAPHAVADAQARAAEGADAVAVSTADVAALLCFADCVPVVIASPTGRFAVAHAGWRGVMNGIAPKAVRALAAADAPELGPDAAACYNVYVGPHIHAECFETGPDVRARFVEGFGAACAPDERHVDLLAALSAGLAAVGVDPARIADAGICTMCAPDDYFSYRASGGVCGRHGAITFRKAV